MKSMKWKLKRKNFDRKQLAGMFVFACFLSVMSVLQCGGPVFAAGEDIVNSAFDVIYNLIAAVVSSIGTILLLWGVFEWAQSLNVQDGGAQSMAFKRIAAGLIATIGPQLIPLITSQIGA